MKLSDDVDHIFDGYNFVFSNHKYNCGITLSMSEFKNILQVKAILSLLDELQFPEYYTCDNACAICGNFEFAGHEPDCKLKLALDAFKCLPDDKEKGKKNE